MNRALAQDMLNCLRVSNASDPDNRSRWAAFSRCDWKQALDWLDLSGLALVF